VILIGQIQLCGVPPECGRGACIVSMLATLGILGLLVTGIYLTIQVLSDDGGPDPELVEFVRIVPYLLLAAELVGVVAWYRFLVQFGRFHGAPGLGTVCALAIGLNLLVFAILFVALLAGGDDTRSRQGRQRDEDKRLRQVRQRDEGGLGWIVYIGSGAVLLTLHITALLKARSLIRITEESG
jgi:membrane protein implicated in regulation of membrane protease activity